MTRLADDMRAEARRLESKASAYRLAGDRLAGDCREAARHLIEAAMLLEFIACTERGEQ